MINCSSGDAFGVLSCQFWNTVLQWCSAADTHHKLLDRVVSGACFLAGGMLNCDLSHCRSVAVLCMLSKIRSNLKHPLCGALPVPFVPVWVTSVYFCASPLQNLAVSQDFYSPLSISLE